MSIDELKPAHRSRETVTGELKRRHAFAMFQAAGPAAAFVGGLVDGLLAGFLHWRSVGVA